MRATTRARKFVRLSYKLPCVTLSYRDMVRRRGPTLGQFCDVFDLHAVALMRPHINEGNLYRRVSCISIVALTHISTNDSKVSYHPSDPWDTFD